MSVDEIFFAVGQVWRTRCGAEARIAAVLSGGGPFPVIAVTDGRASTYNIDGRVSNSGPGDYDLMEMISCSDKGALGVQVGGDHYKSLKIQPIEFIHANDLDFFQGNIVKYAARHKAKSGAADLRKVIHYAQLALQMQYGEDA